MTAELETGCNLNTKSRRDRCSCELRAAKQKILIANPPCPLMLKCQKSNIGKSIQLKSTESTVITTLGDRFIFEYPSNASSWIEFCIHKPIVRSSDFLFRSMATMKSAKAENVTAVKTAKKVGGYCQVCCESVAVEKTTVKTAKTIVAKQAERNALSKGIRPRGSVDAVGAGLAGTGRRSPTPRRGEVEARDEIEENSKADGEAAELKR